MESVPRPLVWFAVDSARTVDTEVVAVSEAISAAPDLKGNGWVHDLSEVAATRTIHRCCANETPWRQVA